MDVRPDPCGRLVERRPHPERHSLGVDRPVDERLIGTLATTAVSAWLGARIYRVHEVAETRQVLDMVATLRGERPPARTIRGLA